ncbi:MAG: hypothetical protein A2Z71_08130 [Chloroflexi bacterium RBG_13_50_21]|nr:MAG: hypothetical protein A2Z71_08130 [Chloroflexi bacterium RBG_13_50_21]
MLNRISSNYRLHILITLITLSILLFTSCAKPTATPTPIDKIQPGDTVNGVLVTTGLPVPATYLIRRLLLVKNPESCQIITFSTP